MAGQHYCLRWNNYQTNMTSVFHQLLKTEAFVDVTLSCNDNSLKAHKVVLSACSSYFQKILMQNPCSHPTIILPSDVSFNDLRVIIDFVYRGEIDVDQAQLQSLLKTADQLKIKGLCEVSDSRECEDLQPSYKPLHFFESVKSVNFENTVQPATSYKNPVIAAEISVNQIPKIKQTTSPVFSQDSGFVAVKQLGGETKDVFAPVESKRQFIRSRKLSPTGSGALPSSTVGSSSTTGRSSPVRKRPRASLKDRAVQSDTSDGGNMINLQPATTDNASALQIQNHNHDGEEQVAPPPLRHHQPQVWRWVNNNGERVPECITVATSTAEDEKNVPLVILERPMSSVPMIVHSMPSTTNHPLSPHHLIDSSNSNPSSGEQTPPEVDIPPEAQPPAPSATLVENLDLTEQVENVVEPGSENSDVVKVKFETLRSVDQSGDTVDMDSHMSDRNQDESDQSMQTMMITPELLGLLPGSSGNSDAGDGDMKGGKGWTQEDMDMALDALKNHNMSLTRASATYGIPSTTLWQRAHRLGIDTPKKEGSTKNWTEDNLNSALEALRTGTISANKASKAFGIPSSTLYKIARREGIRLAAPFNAAPTAWTQEDLERALESIRSGQASVQRASTEFGIPTGTLYGRCKREGIELSRSNPTPWSEDAMGEALEAVRVGQMSINQAAIHYNLPYSSLYGRFKRGKFDADDSNHSNGDLSQAGFMLAGYGDGCPVVHQGYQQQGS